MRFRESNVTAKSVRYFQNGFHLEGIEVGSDSMPLVVFVHGSPGSWTDYLDILTNKTLVSKTRMIAFDRLGYGGSSQAAETSLQKHAASLAEMLQQKYPGEKAVWVGHSYGGSVIARLAIDYPDVVNGMVIVAGAIDPELEKKEWFNTLASWKIIQWILPGILVQSNKEILALKKELEAMLPLWVNISVPVTVIQGTADRLVPPGNAVFAKRVLVNATPLVVREVDKMGHFVPWQNPELIHEAVVELISASTKE